MRHARHRRGDAPPLRVTHPHRHVQLRVLQILTILILLRPRQIVVQAPRLRKPVERAVLHRLRKRRKHFALHARPAARACFAVGHMLLHRPQRPQRRHALRAQHRRAAAHHIRPTQRLRPGQHQRAAPLVVVADHPERGVIVVSPRQIHRRIHPRQVLRRKLVHANCALLRRSHHILHIFRVKINHFPVHIPIPLHKKGRETLPGPSYFP